MSNKKCVQVYLEPKLFAWFDANRKQQQRIEGRDISRSTYAVEIIETHAKSKGYTEEEPPTAEDIGNDVERLIASNPEDAPSVLRKLALHLEAVINSGAKCLA